MSEIKNLLDGVIETEIENLKSLETGSEEKSKAVSILSTLHKLRIEEIKTEIEAEDKRQRRSMEDIDREREEAFRQSQLKDGGIDRYVKLGLGVAELMLPLMFYNTWMKMGFEFEKEGTITSSVFKNLINRFKPCRKG